MMKSLFIIPITFSIFCSAQNLTNQALVNNMNINLQASQANLNYSSSNARVDNLDNTWMLERISSENQSVHSGNNYKSNKKNNQGIHNDVNLSNTNQSKVINTDNNSIQMLNLNDEEIKTSNSKITNVKQPTTKSIKSFHKYTSKNNHYKLKNTYKKNFWYNLKKAFSKTFGKKKKVKSTTRCAKW